MDLSEHCILWTLYWDYVIKVVYKSNLLQPFRKLKHFDKIFQFTIIKGIWPNSCSQLVLTIFFQLSKIWNCDDMQPNMTSWSVHLMFSPYRPTNAACSVSSCVSITFAIDPPMIPYDPPASTLSPRYMLKAHVYYKQWTSFFVTKICTDLSLSHIAVA